MTKLNKKWWQFWKKSPENKQSKIVITPKISIKRSKTIPIELSVLEDYKVDDSIFCKGDMVAQSDSGEFYVMNSSSSSSSSSSYDSGSSGGSSSSDSGSSSD